MSTSTQLRQPLPHGVCGSLIEPPFSGSGTLSHKLKKHTDTNTSNCIAYFIWGVLKSGVHVSPWRAVFDDRDDRIKLVH